MLEMPHYSCTCHTSTINISMAFINLWIIPRRFHFQHKIVRMMTLQIKQFYFKTFPSLDRRVKNLIFMMSNKFFLRIDFLPLHDLRKLYSLSHKNNHWEKSNINPVIFQLYQWFEFTFRKVQFGFSRILICSYNSVGKSFSFSLKSSPTGRFNSVR